MDQVAHENHMEVVLEQTSALGTYINKGLENNDFLGGQNTRKLDIARTSGNDEQIEVLTPTMESLEGTKKQLILAYLDWMTVGNNDENKIKGQTKKVNDIELMSPTTTWGHSAKWDDVSARDSESFTVLPP